MKRTLLLISLSLPLLAGADEGMWTYDDFPAARVAARYGFTPTPAWLEEARLASARLAGGCSASFVSPEGLVMTNHHCVHRCVQDLSTAARDLVADGFQARSRGEERQCPSTEVNQLLRITDVTARVKKATAGTDGKRFHAALVAEKARIEKACQTSAELRCEVVTLHHGGVYSLYEYRRYQDVRLVFAPEFAIAFFGGDPDNFNFPRFDLDVAFLRVYEGGKPARTPRFFRWSERGAAAGELTFVSGNPGKTDRLLTVAQLAAHRDVILPDLLERLGEERGLIEGFQLIGPEEKRVSTSRLLQIENGVKARRGMRAALLDPAFFARKVKDEQDLRAAVARDPALAARYLPAWGAVEAAQAHERRLRGPYEWLELLPAGRAKVGGELLWMARHLLRAGAELARPDGERLEEYRDSALPALRRSLLDPAPVSPAFEKVRLAFWLSKVRERLGADHPAVARLLGKESPEELARRAVDGTRLLDPEVRRRLWEGGAAAVAASQDPLLALARVSDADAREIRRAWEEQVDGVVKKNQALIAEARFAVHGRSIYPDATFSPRLSYGQVKGWREGDREVPPFTTFAGAFARDTGRAPYALPRSWLDARDRLDLSTPFDFVTDNDAVGGNSGSPVFDRELRIVGVLFDGNLHSLGGDYGFDPAVNRSVAVHSSAILEALSKIYGAERLVAELRPSVAGAPSRAGAARDAR